MTLYVRPTLVLSNPGAGLPRQYQVLSLWSRPFESNAPIALLEPNQPRYLLDNTGVGLAIKGAFYCKPTLVLSDPDAGLPQQYQVLFRLVPAIRIKHAYNATRTQPTKPFVVTTHTPFTN